MGARGSPDYDVVIAGGGIAGASAAITLARAGWRVALVARAGVIVETGETLPGLARPLLEFLGAWERFSTLGSLPLRQSHSLWGQAQRSRHPILSPYGEDWVVPKGRLVGMLRELAARAGAAMLDDEITQVGRSGDRSGRATFELQLARNGALSSQTLIDATGRSARVARMLGARRNTWDRLAAVVWHAGHADNEPRVGHTAVSSHDAGWWYAARLPEGGFSVTNYYYPSREENSAAALRRWSRDEVPFVDPEAVRDSPIYLSAASSCLSQASGRHWAAVGDAACAFDPLSAAGIVTALRTSLRAAAAIALDLEGDATALHEYGLMVNNLVSEYARRRQMIYASAHPLGGSGFWERATKAAPSPFA